MAVKETKPKEKETTFFIQRFRKPKDSQEKRKSQLLEHEITQTENSQVKTNEKTNNVQQDNKDFDIPQLKKRSDSVQDIVSTQSSGKELENNKTSDENKLTDSSGAENSTVHESVMYVKDGDLESEIDIKTKRSKSLSFKKSPRHVIMKRSISATQEIDYSKLKRNIDLGIVYCLLVVCLILGKV